MADISEIRYLIGIDPGLSGGITRIDITTGATRCVAMPIIKGTPKRKGPRGGIIPAIKTELDMLGLARLIDYDSSEVIVYIERVGAMPGQGVTSVWRFAWMTSAIHGICAARGIVPNLITPQVWKGHFGLHDDKNESRIKAGELIPALAPCWPLVKNDGKAESALIALFGAFKSEIVLPPLWLESPV